MQIAVISLFPEMFDAVTQHGITGRAISKGLLDVTVFNPREFTSDKHRTVDDRPYGGGPGMVAMVQPWQKAIHKAKLKMSEAVSSPVKTVYLSPQGSVLDHAKIQLAVEQPGLILVAGRYEGLDERLIEREIDEEWSIGDYVLSGGELPAMVVIDGLTRHLPGALGHEDSAGQDSFANGLLDCSHYTRPEELNNMAVPSVLMSGDHKAIAEWREKSALGNTWLKRPDLLEKVTLSTEQKQLLAQFIHEYQQDQEKS